jgi:hypothetical protein
MRNMLALFGAALLTVVGVGWYLGWYKVRSQPASVPGQHSVNININTDKISKDLQNSEQKLQNLLENKGSEHANKPGDLMLPSPTPATTGDKTPLFQFHDNKGASLDIIGGSKGPMLDISVGDKKK